ncbi:ABC transporter substrate-binding protein (plasmid) [Mesorhizobium sp. ORM8.1]
MEDYFLFRQEVSRRAVLAGAAGLGVLTFVGPKTLAADGPQQGGSVRLVDPNGSQSDTLDPATWTHEGIGAGYGGSVCNNLTEVMPDGGVTGDLADKFETSDAKTWVFYLRKNIKFHNGKPLTVKDVVASFEHHTKNKATAASAISSQIDNVSADGNGAVKFVLKSANADLAYLLAAWNFPIMPADDDGTLNWAAGIGTGPFTLENFQAGRSLKLKRNPSYHKPGKPYFDEVEWVYISDVVSSTNALTTGEVDWVAQPDPKTMDLLKRNTGLQMMNIHGPRHFNFAMNTQLAPFNDVNVRLALKHAINREEIVKKLYGDTATVANDDPLSPVLKFSTDPLPRHTYDIEKAKQYLKAAGLTELSIELSTADSAYPSAVEAAELFQQQAAPAGINIKVIREASDGYWSNVWLNKKKGFLATDWTGRATADWTFSVELASDSAWNETFWENKRFNELLVAARGETDDAKRGPIYAEMQQIVHDDGGLLTYAFANYVHAASKKIGYGQIGPLIYDCYRLAERWWIVT